MASAWMAEIRNVGWTFRQIFVVTYPKLNNVHAEVHKYPKVQEWMLKTYGKEI